MRAFLSGSPRWTLKRLSWTSTGAFGPLRPQSWGNRTEPIEDATVKGGSRGFTLIELLIVLGILVIAAAAVIPNVVAYERSQQAKSMEASIIRLPLEAKNEAVKAQVPVRLRLDGDTIIMERVPVDANGNEQPETVKQLQLTNGFQIETAQTANTYNNASTAWQWTAYPDGSADAAGIQFSVNSQEKSLIMPARGNPEWVDGPLPDQTQQTWPAGQLSVRSQ